MTPLRTRRHKSSTVELRELLRANRCGVGLGVYTICSAYRFVLEAGMLQAARDESLLLIECTPNQVNQSGGYTGQTPADFVNFVGEVARDMRFPREQIVLGGDHLGPHVWRKVTAAMAMEKARELVRDYVLAGFTKIHLDASMPCADDHVNLHQTLSDETVSERSADLCETAEKAYRSLPKARTAPLYVIGSEVPAPGGEQAEAQAPKVTRTGDLARTLEVARKAFAARGLRSAWERVIAVVVQPGVEFGDTTVFPYDCKTAAPLARFRPRHWNGIYEAHSTDYQTSTALREMVREHFAILKVGPWLTFAFREAVFALEAVEREWLSGKIGITLSGVQQALEDVMNENPAHWKGYYRGDESALKFARKYSYSDRARYYWPQALVCSALQRLIHNLTAHPAPPALLSQYVPNQAKAVRAGELANLPVQIIRDKILEVIDQYAYACGMRS